MANTEAQEEASTSTEEPRYILFTQCLQNDFFLNRQCRLRLPDNEVGKMLVGRRADKSIGRLETAKGGHRVRLDKGTAASGPLGLFLKTVVERRRKGDDGQGILHVINIRDCHEPGSGYDEERRRYGPHCEKGTWGSDYIAGFEEYLDPARKKRGPRSSNQECQFFREGSVRIYHVHSDSVFDFKPSFGRSGSRYKAGKYRASDLENILDLIVMGSDRQIDELADTLERSVSSGQEDKRREAIEGLVDKVRENPTSHQQVYTAVIGVYTDIKVKTLLIGLHSRYSLSNLAVSDTLTASPSLERHLGALDFAQKVLNVEVIHGLNNLVRFLGGSPSISNDTEIVAVESFSDFASYFQDKQNVLGYETERLRDYVYLTQKRAENVYKAINRTNKILMGWGIAFLFLTLVGAVLNLVWPERFSWQPLLITGGLSLLQLLSAFLWRPMEDLQDNLTNLATFRMILESHSFKTALARFHLTTPQTLRENIKLNAASEQVKALEEQIAALERIEARDYQALKDLGFGAGEVSGTQSEGTSSSETKGDDGQA